jgi:hypothetical protein
MISDSATNRGNKDGKVNQRDSSTAWQIKNVAMGSEHRGERRRAGEDGELSTIGPTVTDERHNTELHRWKGLRLGTHTRELRGWEERRPAEWDWQQLSPASGAMGSSASPDPGLGLSLDPVRQTSPRPTLELGLSLDPGRRTSPRPTPGLGLSLGLGRRSPPRLTPWLGLSLDIGRRTPPRPTPGLRLDLDLGGAFASRPTSGSDPPHHREGHHYPTPS